MTRKARTDVEQADTDRRQIGALQTADRFLQALLLGFALGMLLFALCHCGGARFGLGPPEGLDADAVATGGDAEVLDPADAAAGDVAVAARLDAGASDVEVLADGPGDGSDAETPTARADAGAGAGDVEVLVDAPHEAAAPAPALCCLTPCGGSVPAAIACSSGWTCDSTGGTVCGVSACGIASSCHWQGATCVGRVEVCP